MGRGGLLTVVELVVVVWPLDFGSIITRDLQLVLRN